MPSVLFIGAHRPDRSPSQRFRFEQYIGFLKQNGFECNFSWLVSPSDDSFLYKQGSYFKKFSFILKSYKIRNNDLKHASDYDIIFVQREAIMFRSFHFEKAFSKRAKFIFDFDDAIWIMDVSDGNRHWKWLKDPSKTSKIIGLADMVFAGNSYLSSYALQFNKKVKVVPTTIDTDYHKRNSSVFFTKEKICIGWSGSTTTIKHFKRAESFLIKIKEKFGNKVYFKLIGSDIYENHVLDLKGIKWNLDSEIDDLSEIDIGIMPLPDDEWAKGKCGFKGLQYMALEIPAVMSPVGVNTEIISDGINGYLAKDDDEWVAKISRLIESESLRRTMGAEGRKTIVERYSVDSQKHQYLQYFIDVLKGS